VTAASPFLASSGSSAGAGDIASCDASERLLRARLDLVVATLPFTIFSNPIWAAFTAIVAFGGLFPEIGSLSVSAIALIVACHLANSFYALVLMRRWRRNAMPLRRMRQSLILLQTLISLAWALGLWLSWVDHNAVNTVFEAVLLAILLWGVTLTRASELAIFCAGLGPVMTLFVLRAVLDGSHICAILAVMGPICGFYAAASGLAARRRIDELLHTRFANEDLATKLALSRDEAVRRRRDAEAANASKTAFVANMSHELRTPLNAILGFSEIIEHQSVGEGVNPTYRAYAGHIHQSGAHLLAIINDILDIAKIDAGKMELNPDNFDPRAAIEAALLLVKGRAEEKHQRLIVSVDPAIGEIMADQRAFKQIVVNLLSNAVKFSPVAGRIDLRGTIGERGVFRLEIADNGPGIPADKIASILEPFNRVDNRYDSEAGGTGLGLTLVNALMRLHGGSVRLANRMLGGLTVTADFAPGSVVRGSSQSAA
jgi:two-component system cell cycle sensor histidine kinase PleC